MKRYLIPVAAGVFYTGFLLFIAWSCSARAADTICGSYARLARAVMEARQLGRPVEDVYAACSEYQCRKLVIDAYQTPRFSTPEFQRDAIEQFVRVKFIACAKANNE